MSPIIRYVIVVFISVYAKRIICYNLTMESESELVRRTYELAQDNNRMLHAMRRNAFFGGLFRLVLWIVAVGVPLYLYFVYFQPVVEQLMQSIGAMKAAGASAGAQAGQFSAQLSNLQELLQKLPGFGGQ
jgi:hypothetical protein